MQRIWRTLGVSVILGVLTGCAHNLEPVAKLGAGTSAVAASYRPFVARLEQACIDNLVEAQLTEYGPYVVDQVQAQAKIRCQPITNQKQTALEMAKIVDGYGAALVELSGMKADALSGDIDGLLSSAGKIKTKAGDSIFDTNVLSAAAKLANIAVELFLGEKTKRVTKQTLQDAHEPLRVTVEAMTLVVTRVYPIQLNTAEKDAKRILLNLQARSQADRVEGNDVASTQNLMRAIPFRPLQVQYLARLDQIVEERKKIVTFSEASGALVEAHLELRDKFDEKTRGDQLAALKKFIQKARALRDSLEKL